MRENKYFSISVLMPTLNAASVLEGCLKSIKAQDYPKDKIEIIIADGGSTDATLKIARKYGAKIFNNPLKTAESGKAVALRQAKGELIILIDSDNLLPDTSWFRQVVAPFNNKLIIGSEPWKYTYRREDGFIDRYCALMGMNDPYCYFLGNYDRFNVLSGKWTGLDLKYVDKGNWIEVVLDNCKKIPTIGANGAVLRRNILLKKDIRKNYFFDVDTLVEKTKKEPVLFAKTKNGIIHLYCGGDIKKFVRKQKRRIRDYLFFERNGIRIYPWQKQNLTGLFRFLFSCFALFPLIYQSIKGYLKQRDIAWFFHPLACWITLIIYSEGKIASCFAVKEMDREGWKQ